MAPGEDVERGRASSAAERQKSIVSMTEFEGMDEYTALQKYILFYRDPRAAGHAVEEAPKKKHWWQSGGGATTNTDLAAEVPDDCKYPISQFSIATSIPSPATRQDELPPRSPRAIIITLAIWWCIAARCKPRAARSKLRACSSRCGASVTCELIDCRTKPFPSNTLACIPDWSICANYTETDG